MIFESYKLKTLFQGLNRRNIVRYFVMFIIVTISTKIIPTCGVLRNHAVYVGLIASTTLALLDSCYPNYVMVDRDLRH